MRKKIVILIIISILSTGYAFGQNTLKPTNADLGIQGTFVDNGSTNVYQTQNTVSLCDGINGLYNDSNSFYFNDPQYYIDITLNQKTNIWAIGASNDPTAFGAIICKKYDGSSWIDYQTYNGGNGASWNKIFNDLPAGRYRFSQNYKGTDNFANYTCHGEWYLETIQTSTPPVIDTNTNTNTNTNTRGILEIHYINGTEKEFDLSMVDIQKFISWFETKSTGNGANSYGIKYSMAKPYINRIFYSIFDKILSFEVNEYNN